MSIEKQVIDFFIDNPYPDDTVVHEFADSIGINKHILEKKIYELISTFLCGGKAADEGINKKDADPDELATGTEIEYEHTDKDSPFAPYIAERITLDHIAEVDNYYITNKGENRLKKMEKEAKNEQKVTEQPTTSIRNYIEGKLKETTEGCAKHKKKKIISDSLIQKAKEIKEIRRSCGR